MGVQRMEPPCSLAAGLFGERQYVYMMEEKSKWEHGPWMSEPDIVRWQDEGTELECAIVRNSPYGCLSYWVCIPNEHPAAEIGIKSMREWPGFKDLYNWQSIGMRDIDNVFYDCPKFNDIPKDIDHVVGQFFSVPKGLCPGLKDSEGEYRDIDFAVDQAQKLARIIHKGNGDAE